MHYSLNELNFVLTRAYVGRGLSYALAAECARASLWLARHGTDLDALLQQHLSTDFSKDTPLHWQGNQLCGEGQTLPAQLAALACADYLVLHQAQSLELHVNEDLLFIGLLGVNRPRDTQYRLSIADQALCLCDKPCGVLPPIPNAATLTLSISNGYCALPKLPDHGQALAQEGVDLTRVTWQVLQAAFKRTLVPASAESRARAGAGETDND